MISNQIKSHKHFFFHLYLFTNSNVLLLLCSSLVLTINLQLQRHRFVTTKYMAFKNHEYLLTSLSHIYWQAQKRWLCFLIPSTQSTAGEKLLRDGPWEQLWESEWSIVLILFVSAHCLSTGSLKVVLSVAYHWSSYVVVFFPRETANCRMETVTADMPLCQRRRRTWQCSGGEGIGRRSFICNQITQQMDCVETVIQLTVVLSIYLFWLQQILYLISLFFPFCLSHSTFSFCLQARYERAAGNWESLRRGAALCIAGVDSLHWRIHILVFHRCLRFHVLFLCVTGICLWDG